MLAWLSLRAFVESVAMILRERINPELCSRLLKEDMLLQR